MLSYPVEGRKLILHFYEVILGWAFKSYQDIFIQDLKVEMKKGKYSTTHGD